MLSHLRDLLIQLNKFIAILPCRLYAFWAPCNRGMDEDIPERGQSPRSASERTAELDVGILQLDTPGEHPFDYAVHAGPNLMSDVVLHLLPEDGFTALDSIGRNVMHLELPIE